MKKTLIYTGDLTAKAGEIYELTEITGSLDANGANTKTAFPKLTHTGNSEALTRQLAKQGLSLQDGVLSFVISKRGPVTRLMIVGQSKLSYMVERDGKTAHGATLDEARADLILKIGNSDATPYKNWTLDTESSLQDMIVAYRTITGACGLGVSHFLFGKNYPKELSVGFVIGETVGKYGHETFKAFFKS